MIGDHRYLRGEFPGQERISFTVHHVPCVTGVGVRRFSNRADVPSPGGEGSEGVHLCGGLPDPATADIPARGFRVPEAPCHRTVVDDPHESADIVPEPEYGPGRVTVGNGTPGIQGARETAHL